MMKLAHRATVGTKVDVTERLKKVMTEEKIFASWGLWIWCGHYIFHLAGKFLVILGTVLYIKEKKGGFAQNTIEVQTATGW